jgi:transposase
MEAYSKEFRRDVLRACDEYPAETGTMEVARRFNVSEAWVRLIKQQRRETGQVAPKMKRQRTPKWRAWAEWIVAKIDGSPDIYLRELRDSLRTELGETASLGTLCAACAALGRPRKKRRSSPPNNSGRTSSSAVKSGPKRDTPSTRTKSSSSTKRGLKRT